MRSYRQQHAPQEGSESNSCPLFYLLIALFSLWLPSTFISSSPHSPYFLQYCCFLSSLPPFKSYLWVNPLFPHLFIDHVISHLALCLFTPSVCTMCRCSTSILSLVLSNICINSSSPVNAELQISENNVYFSLYLGSCVYALLDYQRPHVICIKSRAFPPNLTIFLCLLPILGHPSSIHASPWANLLFGCRNKTSSLKKTPLKSFFFVSPHPVLLFLLVGGVVVIHALVFLFYCRLWEDSVSLQHHCNQINAKKK